MEFPSNNHRRISEELTKEYIFVMCDINPYRERIDQGGFGMFGHIQQRPSDATAKNKNKN